MTETQKTGEFRLSNRSLQAFFVVGQSAAIFVLSLSLAWILRGYALLVIAPGTLIAMLNTLRLPSEWRSELGGCWLPLPFLAFFWLQGYAIWQAEVDMDFASRVGIWILFLTGVFSSLWCCLDRTQLLSRNRAVVASWGTQAVVVAIGVIRVILLSEF